MGLEDLLLDFAIILVAAEIGSIIFQRLGLSPLLGVLLAGVVLSPFTPGHAVDVANIEQLAVLGAVFIMFYAGLQFDLREFRIQGLKPVTVAILGTILSLILGMAVGLALGFDFVTAAFLGLVLMSTSSAITLVMVRQLGTTRPLEVPETNTVITAILMDDIVALVILTMVIGFLRPGVAIYPLNILAGLAAFAALLVVLIYVALHAVPRVVDLGDRLGVGRRTLLAVAFGLLVAYGFSILRLPPFAGAFFAGSIIGTSGYGPEVSSYMRPLEGLFGAVFFASIGLLIDPRIFWTLPVAVGLLTLAAIAGKVGGGLTGLRLARTPVATALAPALLLVPRGEVSLVVASYGVQPEIGANPTLLPLAGALCITTTLIVSLAFRLTRERPPEEEGLPTAPGSTLTTTLDDPVTEGMVPEDPPDGQSPGSMEGA
jgi:Kef-type K+ transport system membrane component KefB